MANKKFGTYEVMDCTVFDTVTNRPVLHLDTLKVSSLENTSQQYSIRGGKGNAEILVFDFGKESTLRLQDALLSTRSFELLSGQAVQSGSATVHMRQDTEWAEVSGVMTNKGEYYPLTASGAGAITLAFTPLETAANILVYELEDDCGTPLQPGTLSGTTLTNENWAGKKLVVYYTHTVANAQIYTLSADKFPSIYKLVGDTVIRNAITGKDESFQMIIPRLKFSANFNISFQAGEEPQPFDMDAKVMREANSPRMVTMIQY